MTRPLPRSISLSSTHPVAALQAVDIPSSNHSVERIRLPDATLVDLPAALSDIQDLVKEKGQRVDDPSSERKRDGDLEVEAGGQKGDSAVGFERGSDFPDGGLQAWLVVFGGFCTVFCGFGICAGIGAYQTLYRTTFLIAYTDSEISWIISTQAFVTFGAACFTGSLFDKFGHRPLIVAGGFCLVLGFCMLSLCTKYYQLFLVHATLIAMGCNLLFICPVGVVGQWFDKRRGLAFGLLSTGSSFGAVIWPTILANLPQRIGFGWTCRVMALICFVCSALSFTLLKTRLPPKPPGPFFYLEAFRSLEYNLIVICFVTFCFAFFAYMNFIGTYGLVQGLGNLAPYLLVITNACSAVGRLSSGVLADKVGIYNTVLVGNVVLCIMFWVWLACKSTASIIILVVVIGLSGGAFIALQPPLATVTCKDMRYGGTMLGQALFIQSFAQLACGPIYGALIGHGTPQDQARLFPHALALGGIMMLLATVALGSARLRHSRTIWIKV